MKLFRTTYCGFLNLSYLNKVIKISGWVNKIRNHGRLIFIDLRDKTGLIQVVILKKINNIFINLLKCESCVTIYGLLSLRNNNFFNFFCNTGNIEVICLNLKIFNISKNLPVNIFNLLTTELNRLKNRVLYLRSNIMYNNLFIRFKIINYIRNILNKEKFIDIETPYLTKSTPEGSRDYLVPYRFNIGQFFALPQSPQIFKQLLMISNFDRYYQIVRCFRDEDLRSNRQPEFTQLDCELSFNNEINIKFLFENIILFIFFKILSVKINRFFIIKYKNSLKKFFSDKPDLRFKSIIFNLTYFLLYKFFFKRFYFRNFNLILIKLFNGINLFGNNFKNYKFFLNYIIYNKLVIILTLNNDYYNIYLYDAIKKFNFNKVFIFELLSYIKLSFYNLFFLVFCKNNFFKKIFKLLFKKICFSDYSKKNNLLNFSIIPIWIVNFPLFKYNYNLKKIDFMHNPFTLPVSLDILYLDFNPIKCLSRSYDIVLNGSELGGGSIRNNKLYIQKKIFIIMNVRNLYYNFGFFLKSLVYGSPFHGGIAFGIDRLIAILLGIISIREVIAFPKTQSASCLFTQSPSLI